MLSADQAPLVTMMLSDLIEILASLVNLLCLHIPVGFNDIEIQTQACTYACT